ncbi:MAG: 30S ribosomal protein S7 [Oscillospiraceae bacterium]|jgi:small subunit ribosomal protein S7|nr:30S ribosomal protein S7 [Oscillospiraceae bacterium]
MPRKGAVSRRDVLSDPIYNSKLITRLINVIMFDGKKSTAQSIVYAALDKVREKINRDPLEIFEKAMENASPSLEVKARRVGGATYQVPMEVRAERRRALGLRWIVKYARERSERTMVDRLAGEISDAFSNSGAAVKKRDDTHKMAEANKAFAHYRW